MVKIIHDNDADLSFLQGKTIGIIGYGNQGSAQAQCLRDSGIKVVIGETEILNDKQNPSWQKALNDGFETKSISEVAKIADIIHILLPDEFHGPVYKKSIRKYMKVGKTLSCSHGFNIIFKGIVPPPDVDVIMVAPKSPATEERKAYLAGFGVPGLIAVRQNPSGNAKNVALAMAKAMRFTRAGCLECTFEQETFEDLFGEQTVLCGGLVELMKAGFEVLVEAGYPPEMAYFECVHEMKLIVDLIYEGGIQKMNSIISNTAEWGEYETGPKIITPKVKEAMKKALRNVENGKFARKWLKESKNGAPTLKAKREALGQHPIEVVGRQIRSMFEKKN
jgi:ketol-acid reductoisomerase